MTKRMTEFEMDQASAEMEKRECEERDEAVRNLAPQLALALRAADRLLINHLSRSMDLGKNDDYRIVESAIEKLQDAEGY